MSETDRLLRSMREIVLTFFPRERFRGWYEFTVTAQNDNHVDLRPTSVSEGLSDIPSVPFRAGTPGGKGELQVGSRVLVSFINGDQSRPFLGFVEGPDGGGFIPLNAALDASQKVEIGASAQTVEIAGGAQFVALENLVKSELQSIEAALKSHTHKGVTNGGGSTDASLDVAYVAGDVKATKTKVT
jgi:hypothetical protein